MTIVEFFKNNRDNIIRYKISGHSGFAESGSDIVCAAVSVLSQTVLMSLVDVVGIPETDIDFYIDDNRGILDVNIPKNLDQATTREVEIVLKTLELGIKSIVEIYPEYVTLKYREV